MNIIKQLKLKNDEIEHLKRELLRAQKENEALLNENIELHVNEELCKERIRLANEAIKSISEYKDGLMESKANYESALDEVKNMKKEYRKRYNKVLKDLGFK